MKRCTSEVSAIPIFRAQLWGKGGRGEGLHRDEAASLQSALLGTDEGDKICRKRMRRQPGGCRDGGGHEIADEERGRDVFPSSLS